MNRVLTAIVLGTAALGATAASAATLYTLTAATAEFAAPSSYSVTFASGAGAGSTTFEIAGYGSLDGVNCCTDIFNLSLNGTTIFSGSFDLGGGGSDVVYISEPGATATSTSFGFYQGGKLDITTPLALIAGTNTLTFAYAGGGQGLSDEGWGVTSATVTGPSSTVPEPAAWALFVAGFGLVGAAVRNRRIALGA